jgi:hypothetical protein
MKMTMPNWKSMPACRDNLSISVWIKLTLPAWTHGNDGMCKKDSKTDSQVSSIALLAHTNPVVALRQWRTPPCPLANHCQHLFKRLWHL